MTDHTPGVIAPRSLRRTLGRSSGGSRHAAALVGLSAAMLVPAHAYAQAQAQEEEAPLATIAVEDTAIDPNPNAQLGVPFKAKTSGDERRTRPIAETPATISVLTRAQLEQSGYTDLKAILDAQPGVTVGTGENGNAFGDRYVLRGQEVKSDVFVDGLRDPGLTTRESFAIEQIEITKGPSSSFAGRGASGGAINAITKAATTDFNFARADVGYGSDNYIRTTADINYAVTDGVAVRVNGLFADTDVPYRGLADRRRWGAAVSALFQPADNLKIVLDYYYMRAREKPDVGSFLVGDAPSGTRFPYYLPAYTQSSDFVNSDVDTWTARVKWELADNVTLSNSFRYGQNYNTYFISALASQVIPTSATTSYQTGRIDNGHTGWQDVKYYANQTNLRADVDLLGAKHEIIAGLEYTNHKVQTTVGSASPTSTTAAFLYTQNGAFNCATTLGGANNQFCITDAGGNPVANLGNLTGRTITGRTPFAARRWQIETISGYLMDTVDLSPALTLFAGARFDRYSFNISAHSTTTGALTPGSAYEYADTLWNGHLGLTYKVGNGGLFYATVSTAADINGGESDTNGAGYGGFIPPVAGEIALPERSWNYEIGTKWNVLDEKLLITAALFRTVKSNTMEGADYGATGSFNTGKFRVQGFDFSIQGNITDKWSVQGGFTVMRAKVLESADIPGVGGVTMGNVGLNPTNTGKTLANFADVSAQFMTRYQITDKFAAGAAFKYKSKRYGGQPDTAAAYTQLAPGQFVYSQPVPSYFVTDLSAEYHLTNNVELRLNVNNLFNKNYYLAAYRAGFFLYQGDKRQVVGTISAKF